MRDYYYFEESSGRSQWSHPLDQIYRDKVREAREEGEDKSDSPQSEEGAMRPAQGKLVKKGGLFAFALKVDLRFIAGSFTSLGRRPSWLRPREEGPAAAQEAAVARAATAAAAATATAGSSRRGRSGQKDCFDEWTG